MSNFNHNTKPMTTAEYESEFKAQAPLYLVNKGKAYCAGQDGWTSLNVMNSPRGFGIAQLTMLLADNKMDNPLRWVEVVPGKWVFGVDAKALLKGIGYSGVWSIDLAGSVIEMRNKKEKVTALFSCR